MRQGGNEEGVTDPQRLAVIALGSNRKGTFGSSRALLEAAVEALAEAGLVALARSSWWRSAAWPDADDPPFLNGVVLVGPQPDPAAMLARLHEVEDLFGRVRDGLNSPRTLDLDLIAHGRTVGRFGPLIVPHPRARARRFVMGPLAEIAPDWRWPGTEETAVALAEAAPVGRDARPA